MLISGWVSRSFYHQCASTRGFRPFDPDSINKGQIRQKSYNIRHGVQ
jgi:hypothetical protein